MSIKKEGVCKLCNQHAQLVDSHIIPKSFYGKWAKERLVAISLKTRQKIGSTRNGLYDQFLCKSCEYKFNDIDNFAAQMFMQSRYESVFHKDESSPDKFQVGGRLCSKVNINKIHIFAASLLWRALSCSRNEFEELRNNLKENSNSTNNSEITQELFEQLTRAIFNWTFDDNLLNKFGLKFMQYEGSKNNADAAHVSFRTISGKVNVFSKEVSLFTETYGYFSCFSFGFPNGEILMRVGGEKPRQGYFVFEGHNVALWSCNVSEKYPYWFSARTPMIDGKGFVSNPILKNLLDFGINPGYGGA
jgi:hypothetical protein